jgi:ubiquinone/menaquinone biosynthesis C-methylase UbiE
MTSAQDQSDIAFLQTNARAIRAAGLDFWHLDQTINLHNYVRIANDIAAQLPDGARILDWGCGWGQMSWLLRRRALQVTSFELGPDDMQLPDIPLCEGLHVVRTQHPTHLPFPDQQLDGVLSCGVLEHVDEYSEAGNEKKSLREIARILRPGGKLLVYQLPQRAAWQEAVVRRFKLGYSHPRRYSSAEITALLDDAGFDVQRMRRANLVPKNLTGMPAALRRIYSMFSLPLMRLDHYACHVPLLNRIAGVMEITAVRR